MQQHLPNPANWKTRTALIVFTTLFSIAITAYLVMETISALQHGDGISAVVAGGLSLTFLSYAASIAAGRLRSKDHLAKLISRGTAFRPDPLAMWLVLLAIVGSAVSSGVFVIVTLVDYGDISLIPAGREVHTLFLMVCLLLISLIGVYTFATRGRSTYFQLSADGAEYADIVRTRSWTWDQVTNVSDTAPKKTRAHHPVVFVLDDNSVVVVHNVDGYAPSGAALYWMVRHYWLHPEDREELTDDRALARLRNEDFKPE